MRDWIALERLHVVSDLHLGGEAGFQIFGSGTELAWLIDQVALAPGPGTGALLVNGDFIDFLAEAPGRYFDPDGAVAKIDAVVARFKPVFDALRRLLQRPGRRLIVNLGNHDLELALPWVRAHLAEVLAGSDEAARARLLLVTDGTGVRCRVGNASVLCVHGNEVDSWNVADYERLRRIGRDLQFGAAPEAWTPNAGTQLVIDVMNEIKRQYPFVDLLKPETEAVLPILAALRPGLHKQLLDLAGVAGRKAWDMLRMHAGFLGDAADGTAGASEAHRAPRVLPLAGAPDSGPALRAQVEQAWRAQVEPIALVRGTQTQQLGFWSATADFVSGKPRHEVLREALEHLDRDRSFAHDQPDATFKDLDELASADIDILIAGHTHLERSLARRQGAGQYFNSGTWAGLMQITPAQRQDEQAFARLFRLLSGGSMAALAAEPGLVQRRNTVVVVEKQAAGVQAALCHVLPAQGAEAARLETVASRPFAGA